MNRHHHYCHRRRRREEGEEKKIKGEQVSLYTGLSTFGPLVQSLMRGQPRVQTPESSLPLPLPLRPAAPRPPCVDFDFVAADRTGPLHNGPVTSSVASPWTVTGRCHMAACPPQENTK